MNEFELLGKVHIVIDEYVNNKMEEWFESNNVNYRLIYPLVAVELGAMNKPPEDIYNLLKRGATGFLYSKALELDKEITLKRFDTAGLNRYLAQYETTIEPLYQNYRFSKEINDINPITKVRIEKNAEHRYQLTTSLVLDKYKEESFYFYGVDDTDNNKAEAKQILDLHIRFHKKIFIEQIMIKDLINNVDTSLYNLCVQAVDKDLNKWGSNVKSSIFSHPHQLALVIGYFYYYAVLKSIELRISKEYTENLVDIGGQCILDFIKDKCIQDIVLLSGLRRDKVEKIIEYFINRGNANILEFPLFEIEEQLITIPSLIMVNDWQFR